ncbi:unnamed protein product [Onchocerca ochengi]|uniref:PH domain-containing protein n=1 Tax=Onchocerca ochengi TaxID=42157 RepID=A0A182EH47_ONCOC|nr:unnamed protein product [Onchocerca ochengi]
MSNEGDVITPSDEELLKELKTGQTFYLKYLGSVQIFESLTKKKPEERDSWTRYYATLLKTGSRLPKVFSTTEVLRS